MKILITGSRNGFNFFRIYYEIDKLNHELGISNIIVGDAKGVDKMVKIIADILNIKCDVFIADWESYGISAGAIRNKRMLEHNPDLVIAFHYNINESRGTLNCLNQAKLLGIKTKLIEKDSDYTGVQYIE